MILEHFASNDEELELANHGFLLWGNANHQYKEAAMGYQNGSDFKFIFAKGGDRFAKEIRLCHKLRSR
jgi:hypothetical protein